MSFTDGKRRIVDEKELAMRSKDLNRFRCALCGHHFQLGDGWRWVYAGNRALLNFYVCDGCDGDDVLDRWKAHNEEYHRRFWYFEKDCTKCQGV